MDIMTVKSKRSFTQPFTAEWFSPHRLPAEIACMMSCSAASQLSLHIASNKSEVKVGCYSLIVQNMVSGGSNVNNGTIK